MTPHTSPFVQTAKRLHGQHVNANILGRLIRKTNHRSDMRWQMIQSTVLRVEDKELTVTGLYGVSKVPRSQVSTANLVAARDATGRLPGDIRPGDVLAVKVMQPFTPYGDTLLAPVSVAPDVQFREVMQELKRRMASQQPVLGRVLNEVYGGYAVGIAGVVARLPYARATQDTVSRVGHLQHFYVTAIDADGGVLLADARRAPQERGGLKGGDRRR